MNRQKALGAIMSHLRLIMEDYKGSTTQCNFECDAMVLGALIKGVNTPGLLPIPGPPYQGLCFNKLAHHLRTMRLPTLCSESGWHKKYPAHRDDSPIKRCGIRELINTHIKCAEDGVSGLELESF